MGHGTWRREGARRRRGVEGCGESLRPPRRGACGSVKQAGGRAVGGGWLVERGGPGLGPRASWGSGERRLEARGRSAARLPPALSRCPRTCPRPAHAHLRREAGGGRAWAGPEGGGKVGGGRGGPTVSNHLKSIKFRIDSNGLKRFATVQIRFMRSQTLKRFETD